MEVLLQDALRSNALLINRVTRLRLIVKTKMPNSPVKPRAPRLKTFHTLSRPFAEIQPPFVHLTLLVQMIATSGCCFLILISRGVCLRNGTCDCDPFYEGSSCGTYKGCPSGLNSTVCSELETTNLIVKTNLSNNGSSSSGGSGDTGGSNSGGADTGGRLHRVN